MAIFLCSGNCNYCPIDNKECPEDIEPVKKTIDVNPIILPSNLAEEIEEQKMIEKIAKKTAKIADPNIILTLFKTSIFNFLQSLSEINKETPLLLEEIKLIFIEQLPKSTELINRLENPKNKSTYVIKFLINNIAEKIYDLINDRCQECASCFLQEHCFKIVTENKI